MITQKLEIIDPVHGFTERDSMSKAILNTDMDSLLKYKIQRRRMNELNRSKEELVAVKDEIACMKSDLCEIKALLLQITKKSVE